jgi:hypothetical protein
MSELKELFWAVQETVEPVPFEQLERRGVRRRRRRQALAGAGAAVATTVAVLAALLPFGGKAGTEQLPPVAPPTASVPGSIEPILPPDGIDQAAQAVVRAKDAEVRSILLATPSRWAASWASCSTNPCKFAAVLSRDGAKVTAPVRRMKYTTLQTGDEAIAMAGPSGESFTARDPSWSQAVLVRLTAQGKVQTPLRYAKPTRTFSAGEILIDRVVVGAELVVLNLADSTLRKLDVPGLTQPHSPVRDSTGRWWVVAGEPGSGMRSQIAWTDDGGGSWQQTVLDPGDPASTIAVSQDGRTIVATSWIDGATFEAIGTLKMSTDRGANWTTVTDKPWAREGGPVAFNDGTALMLGRSRDGVVALYPLDDQPGQTLLTGHDGLDDLTGDGKLLYGPVLTGTTTTKVATSTDRGKTWHEFEPR